MLEAVKVHHTPNSSGELFVVTGKLPAKIVKAIEQQFPKFIKIIEDEECEDFFKTDIYKDSMKRMTPAGNLRDIRKRMSLTQKQLSEKSGVARQAISDMENGRISIGRKMAQRLADALETTYRNLFW